MTEREELKPILYDFLFIDYPRVQSLYSQLYSGLLSEITSLVSESQGRKTEIKAGGSPVGSLSSQRIEHTEEAKTESFNPHDLILRDVLGGLTDAGLVITNPAKSHPGNIVLLHGQVYVLDFSFYESIIPMIPSFLSATDEAPKSKTEKKHQKANKSSTMDLFKAMAKIVPWSIHLIMKTPGAMAWGAIKKEHLREDPTNLTLKNGSLLSGEWYMLAIVDVSPNQSMDTDATFPEVFSTLVNLVESMRPLFGRPDSCIGVTPLLLFRKLSI